MARIHTKRGLTILIHKRRLKSWWLVRLELGNTSRIKWFDGMGEYVIDWGAGYRIYLAQDGDTLIILFGGGTKRGQQRDIDKAKALLHEYKARKKSILQVAKSKKE